MYTIRNYHTQNEFLIYQDKIKILVVNHFKILTSLDHLVNDHLFEVVKQNEEIIIKVYYDQLIEKDGYHLMISQNKQLITIKCQNERGIRYAFNTLNCVTFKKNDKFYLPILEIKDYPSFKLRGIIEGFYGIPWSHEARLDVIETMNTYKMNAFMYAPKDDLYHRNKWRELYPEKELRQLLDYKEKCENYDIDFYYSISPGNDFDYTRDEEFEILFRKINQMTNDGVNHFALLLDDINYHLEGKSYQLFKRPGIAHAYIANKVNAYLKEKLYVYDFILCPTEYFQNFDTQYRNDLNKYLDQSTSVFWTGYNTVSEVINEEDGNTVLKSFGHNLVLWENYPVNDFAMHRLFLGPIINRSTHLPNTHVGNVANPMNQWYASKLAIITLAHYMWNSEKYDAIQSIDIAISDLVEERYQKALKIFMEANNTSVLTKANQFYYDDLIERNDVKAIDEYYKNLKYAIDILRENNNQPMIQEFEPWFKRADKEYKLWNKVSSHVIIDDEELKDCFSYPNELGYNILLQYLMFHNN